MIRIAIIVVLLFVLAGGTWQLKGFFSEAPNSIDAQLGAVNISGTLPENPIMVK